MCRFYRSCESSPLGDPDPRVLRGLNQSLPCPSRSLYCSQHATAALYAPGTQCRIRTATDILPEDCAPSRILLPLEQPPSHHNKSTPRANLRKVILNRAGWKHGRRRSELSNLEVHTVSIAPKINSDGQKDTPPNNLDRLVGPTSQRTLLLTFIQMLRR